MRNKIAYLNYQVKNEKELKKIIRLDPKLKDINEIEAEKYVQQLKYKFVTIFEKEYPIKLKLLKNPPWVLYYQGDLSLLNKKIISINGSSNPLQYTKTATADLIRMLKNDKVIMAGYGNGIAKQVFVSAITNEKKAIAISAYNLDYTQKNDQYLFNILKDKHLVISAALPGVKTKMEHFKKRNELIGVLSNEVCVMEANLKSPILKIVDTALEFNAQIYALPGPIYEKGCQGPNLLLHEGASLIYLENNLL